MSKELVQYIRTFLDGHVPAEVFADVFVDRWMEERDNGVSVHDTRDESELIGSTMCLADLFNPSDDRLKYELNAVDLHSKVAALYSRLSGEAS